MLEQNEIENDKGEKLLDSALLFHIYQETYDSSNKSIRQRACRKRSHGEDTIHNLTIRQKR